MEGFEPRPKASQAVAAQKRARQTADQPSNDAPIRPQHLPLATCAGVIILAMIGMASYQLVSGPTALQLPASTQAPAQVFERAPTALQEAPSATIAPEPTSAIPPPATAAPVEPPPQTGQGMTVDVWIPEPTPAPPPAPSYVENVGQQAKHSPRGGLCGPTGGDCAPGVPFGIDNSQYIQNVGTQKPHKVR
jgi:hypothetical protein